MKYCPDCDMEFIDSVETCTDCGKPLVDKERYLAEESARIEREAAEQTQLLKEQQAALDAEAENAADDRRPAPAVYVRRADRYEDLKSSASAFLIVGIVMVILSVLSWGHALHLPFSIPSNVMLRILFLLFAVGSFAVYIKTTADAKTVHGQIEEEQKATEQLTSWFLESYTPEAVDAAVQKENGTLRPEVLALKRMDYIQDVFITQYDLADQAYVDALSEDIYAKLYEPEQGDE